MANLSNINNKFLVTTGGNVLIGQTNDVGFKLSVAGTVAIGADRSTYIDASEDSSATSHIFTTNAAVGDFSQLAGNLVIQARVHPSVYRDIIFAGGLNTAGPLMTIAGEGNVGIGTSTPSQKLHIVDTDGANIILNSNTGAENNGIWMTEGGVATPYANGAYVHYDSTNNAFKINTGTTSLTTKLTILRDSGNVGIGTTTPGYKLDVAGAINSNVGLITSGYTSATSSLNIEQGITGGYAQLNVYDRTLSSYKDYRIDASNILLNSGSSGNVGIGTTSPTTTLSVQGTTNNGINVIGVGTTATRCYLGLNSANKGYLFITGSSGENPAVITSQGNSYISTNLGIGTTSPDAKLQVSGTSSVPSVSGTFQGSIFSVEGSSTVLLDMGTTGAPGYYTWIQAHDAGNGVNYDLALNPLGGNVGIGTDTPASKLHIRTSTNNNYEFEEVSGELRFSALNDARSANVPLQFAASEFNFISGNVGIGNTSPAATLDVDDDNTGKIRLLRNGSTRVELSNNANEGELSLYRSSTVKTIYISSYYDSYFNGGNVGIGTTTPRAVGSGYKGLEVSSPSSGSSLWLSGFSDTTKGYLAMDTGGLNLTAISNHALTFGTNNSPKMRIWSGGMIQIGNDSSATPELLTLQAYTQNQAFSGKYSASGYLWFLRNETGPSGRFQLYNAGSTTINLEGNTTRDSYILGDLGIGTTSPWTKLAVSGTTASNSPSIGRNSTSTTVWTTILTFTGASAQMYSVLLGTSENSFSQMWRVSGSVIQQTCYYTLLGDSGHQHSKDVEFRLSSGVLQYKNISYTTGRVLYVFDVVQSSGGSYTY